MSPKYLIKMLLDYSVDLDLNNDFNNDIVFYNAAMTEIYIGIERVIKNRFRSTYCKRYDNGNGKITRAIYRKNNPIHQSYFNKRKSILKYHKSEKGKKALARRQRSLSWIPILDNPFPKELDIHYHHINNILVIPLPKIIHLSTYGKNHRERCNYWIDKIYNININKLFS